MTEQWSVSLKLNPDVLCWVEPERTSGLEEICG